MTDKQLKAYQVREDGEGNCVIVFATNGATARREGGGELGLEFDEVESCRRMPVFDQYAPGPVPLHATLAAGWWHECNHCGVRFDEDGRHGEEEYERDDAFEPVQDARRLSYCSPTCQAKDFAEKRARDARQNAAIEAALIRWPMAVSVTSGEYSLAYPNRGTETRANLILPGLRFPVSWPLGSDHAHVSQCDVEAFTNLYGKKEAA
jgi:hypothetical protein